MGRLISTRHLAQISQMLSGDRQLEFCSYKRYTDYGMNFPDNHVFCGVAMR